MGTTPFSNVILKTLIEEGYHVVGVVTQPDRPFGRKKILKAPVVKELALEHQIDVYQPERVKDITEELSTLDLDLIVTCAYGQIVPKAILDLPKYKALNVHASILPKYRGGAPIHWSIIRGDKETGVTLMRMDPKMDAGPFLAIERVEIGADDVMSDVEAKLMDASVQLIKHGLKAYLNGELSFIEQDESQVTFAWAIKPEDEFISFNRPAQTVYNHIRGLISWPTGYGLLETQRVKFHGAAYHHETTDAPYGTIVDMDTQGIKVACADGKIVVLTEVQKAGEPRKQMTDTYHGNHAVWEGKRFE